MSFGISPGSTFEDVEYFSQADWLDYDIRNRPHENLNYNVQQLATSLEVCRDFERSSDVLVANPWYCRSVQTPILCNTYFSVSGLNTINVSAGLLGTYDFRAAIEATSFDIDRFNGGKNAFIYADCSFYPTVLSGNAAIKVIYSDVAPYQSDRIYLYQVTIPDSNLLPVKLTNMGVFRNSLGNKTFTFNTTPVTFNTASEGGISPGSVLLTTPQVTPGDYIEIAAISSTEGFKLIGQGYCQTAGYTYVELYPTGTGQVISPGSHDIDITIHVAKNFYSENPSIVGRFLYGS